jgi:hypothetical protein
MDMTAQLEVAITLYRNAKKSREQAAQNAKRVKTESIAFLNTMLCIQFLNKKVLELLEVSGKDVNLHEFSREEGCDSFENLMLTKDGLFIYEIYLIDEAPPPPREIDTQSAAVMLEDAGVSANELALKFNASIQAIINAAPK